MPHLIVQIRGHLGESLWALEFVKPNPTVEEIMLGGKQFVTRAENEIARYDEHDVRAYPAAEKLDGTHVYPATVRVPSLGGMVIPNLMVRICRRDSVALFQTFRESPKDGPEDRGGRGEPSRDLNDPRLHAALHPHYADALAFVIRKFVPELTRRAKAKLIRDTRQAALRHAGEAERQLSLARDLVAVHDRYGDWGVQGLRNALGDLAGGIHRIVERADDGMVRG